MNSVTGKVVTVAGRKATVALEQDAACPRCAAGRGCGAGILVGRNRASAISIDIPGGRHLQPGDKVTLALRGTSLLQATLLAYGLPLAGTLLLLTCGIIFWSPLTDAAGILLAVTGLVGGNLLSHRILRRMPCTRRFVPTVSGRDDAA